jgi:hypothetical protein
MGFTLATHYCGGQAVESTLAIGEAHIGCGMEEDSEPCANPVLKSKSCCDDKYISMQIEDDFNTQEKQSNVSPVFLFTFAYSYFNLQPTAVVADNVFIPHSPPPLNQNRQVLFQNFLI